MNQRNTQMQDAGGIKQSPLNLAIAKRDGQTLEMVAAAIKHKQTLLAYQPVMMSSDPRQVGFYEGLIRVMDATGVLYQPRISSTLSKTPNWGGELIRSHSTWGCSACSISPTCGSLSTCLHAALGLAHGSEIFTVG